MYQSSMEKWGPFFLPWSWAVPGCRGIWVPGGLAGAGDGSHPSSFQVQPEQLSSSLSYFLGMCVRFVLGKRQNIFEHHCTRLSGSCGQGCVLFHFIAPAAGMWPGSALRGNTPFAPGPFSGMPSLPLLSPSSSYSYYRMYVFHPKIVCS